MTPWSLCPPKLYVDFITLKVMMFERWQVVAVGFSWVDLVPLWKRPQKAHLTPFAMWRHGENREAGPPSNIKTTDTLTLDLHPSELWVTCSYCLEVAQLMTFCYSSCKVWRHRPIAPFLFLFCLSRAEDYLMDFSSLSSISIMEAGPESLIMYQKTILHVMYPSEKITAFLFLQFHWTWGRHYLLAIWKLQKKVCMTHSLSLRIFCGACHSHH